MKIKKLMSLVALFMLSIFMVGCVSSSAQLSTKAFLAPEELVGKVIIGQTSKGVDFSMSFNADNTLSYSEAGESYIGTWKYDSTKTLMAYVLNWDENGTPQGYLGTIQQDGTQISIMCHWYLTDAYKTLFLEGNFTE